MLKNFTVAIKLSVSWLNWQSSWIDWLKQLSLLSLELENLWLNNDQLTINYWLYDKRDYGIKTAQSANCKKYGEIPERSKGTDCKSVGNAFTGSNPVLPTIFISVFELYHLCRKEHWFILFLRYSGKVFCVSELALQRENSFEICLRE